MKVTTLKFNVSLLAVLLSLTTVSIAGEVINFGIISTESTQSLKNLWEPLLTDLSERTGLEVKPYFAPDYAGIVLAMKFNKVQLAYMGNKAAIEAVDRASAEVFIQTTDANGENGYFAYLITQTDSEIRSIEDLIRDGRQYTFGNGDTNSTSGFLVPAYYAFALNGIDPKRHFKKTRSANHEANAMAVANGQVDFATVNMNTLEKLQKNTPSIRAKIRTFWKSPLIPSDPLVWRQDLPDSSKAAIKAFFMNYGKTGSSINADQKKLAELQLGGFHESSNSQLIPIRQLILFRERLNLTASDQPADEAQKVRIAAINEELEVLQHTLDATDKP